MIEHPLPMGSLSCIQASATRGVLTRKRRPYGRQGRRLTQSARPGSVDLRAKALEAERVVAIRTNLAAIPEPGFPLVARGAESPEPP